MTTSGDNQAFFATAAVDAASAFTALQSAFRAIGDADTHERLPEVLLLQSMALMGAIEGAIVAKPGLVRAAGLSGPPTDDILMDPRLWEGLAGEPRLYDEGTSKPWSALSFPMRSGEDLALALVYIPGAAPQVDRLTGLALLTQHAQTRAMYLAANRQAVEAGEQAKSAHQEQMEMALRLYDLYEEAQNQAITDGLTGLATHDFFQQRLAQEMRESFRYNRPLTFMIFDLDHFKNINDTYGHQAGDAVLKGAALMLQNKVRTSDLVARYGGEEFAVILPQTTEEDGYQLAERLRKDLEEMEFPISETRNLKVTASIGLASRGENDGSSKDLIKRADVALYAAKNGGRNRVMKAQGPAVEAVNAIGTPRKGSQEMFYALARAFSAAIEARIPLMHGHSEAVGELARRMGAAMGLNDEKQEALYIAGLLHDVGMMSVPEQVIFKTTKLDPDDWTKMKEHPAAGVGILARFSTFSGLLEAVLYHHERYDGKGYPQGLQADSIPMGARILAICDSYDAMIRGDYAYGVGIAPGAARAEIERCAGGQFDPVLVKLFLGVLAEPQPAAAG